MRSDIDHLPPVQQGELPVKGQFATKGELPVKGSLPVKGGIAKPLPLPMAYQGQFSADGKEFAYSPLPPAYGFDYIESVPVL